MAKTLYTVSSMIFSSKKEAEEQLLKWSKESGLRQGTKLFKVVDIYDVEVTKVIKLKKHEEELPF